MPTLTTEFNGILTGEQLGHIHGENERYRCHLWFAQGSYCKAVRAISAMNKGPITMPRGQCLAVSVMNHAIAKSTASSNGEVTSVNCSQGESTTLKFPWSGQRAGLVKRNGARICWSPFASASEDLSDKLAMNSWGTRLTRWPAFAQTVARATACGSPSINSRKLSISLRPSERRTNRNCTAFTVSPVARSTAAA